MRSGMAGAYAAFVPAGGSAIELAPPALHKDGYFDSGLVARAGTATPLATWVHSERIS